MTDSFPVEIEKTNFSIHGFHDFWEQTLAQTWSAEDWGDHFQEMVAAAKKLEIQINKAGNNAHEFLLEESNGTNKEKLQAYILTHQWAERAKMLMILWRDVLFEEQKAVILWKEGAASEADLKELRAASKMTLQQAFEELKAFPEEQFFNIKNGVLGVKKQLNEWKLQANPWPTYKEQIKEIVRQCELIFKQFETLNTSADIFQDLRALIQNSIASNYKELETAQKTAQTAIEFIKENIQPDMEVKPGKIASQLEDIEGELKVERHLGDFNEALEKLEKTIPEKMKVIRCTRQGMVQFQEIPLRKKVNLWIESEILPVLYEIWELTETVESGLKISLINVRNRALLASSEGKGAKPTPQQFDVDDYSLPLANFSKKAAATIENLGQFEKQINHRLQTYFQLPQIYNGEEFLPIPLSSTINQFKFNQNEVFSRTKNWGSRQWLSIQRFIRSVEHEESLSISEKIVRLIQNRTNDSTNSYYSSIFMTKGYIGESFWVGREAELSRAANLIDQWNHGFRGAIAITGQRFSGKTLFAELVANKHFKNNVIRLSPNQSLIVEGRRFNSSYNLAETLNFVRKHTVNARPMILIDDFEHWWDPTITLSENVRTLRHYIDSYSNRHFIMVTMSNWLKHHLDQIYELSSFFQAEINMDEMRVDEIRSAIIIRHGATHKQLVDEEGKEVSAAQFKKLTNQIHRTSGGNVGEALNRWTAKIEKYDEDRVVQKFKNSYQLPDFINSDNGMMLTALMMEKRTTEYHLRKLFGIAFQEKYCRILHRMISIGLLTRHIDGWLEVNDACVNDLGRLLEKKGFLKFH